MGKWCVVAILQDGTEEILESNIMHEHTAVLIAGARSINNPQYHKVIADLEANYDQLQGDNFLEPDDDPGPIIDRDCDYWEKLK